MDEDKEKWFKKRIKQYNILMWSYLGIILFFLGFIVVYGTALTNNFSYETEINYINLTWEQIDDLIDDIDDVKPLYLKRFKKITFVNSTHEIEEVCGEGNAGCYSRYTKQIWIKYHKGNITRRMILCHELLHDLILNHDVIYDMDSTGVCLKNG